MATPIPYDPKKHHKNALGRWADRGTGRLVTLDPATVPAEPSQAPQATAAPDGPARELESAPLPPVPPVLEDGTGGAGPSQAGPSGSSPGPSGPSSGPSQAGPSPDGLIPTLDPMTGPAVQGDPTVPHDPECWRGAADGRPCPRCMTAIYQRLPAGELGALVRFHEMIVNRATPFPRPFSESEREAVGEALQMVAVRYGNPMAEFAPLLAVAGATVGPIMDRRAPMPVAAEALDRARSGS